MIMSRTIAQKIATIVRRQNPYVDNYQLFRHWTTAMSIVSTLTT